MPLLCTGVYLRPWTNLSLLCLKVTFILLYNFVPSYIYKTVFSSFFIPWLTVFFISHQKAKLSLSYITTFFIMPQTSQTFDPTLSKYVCISYPTQKYTMGLVIVTVCTTLILTQPIVPHYIEHDDTDLDGCNIDIDPKKTQNQQAFIKWSFDRPKLDSSKAQHKPLGSMKTAFSTFAKLR